MYFMYVDESGDCGLNNSPTQYFILSSIVVHETEWSNLLNELIKFRRDLRTSKGLLMKEEIHASEFLTKRIKLRNKITPSDRLDILKQCLVWLSKQPNIHVISVRVDKQNSQDPFLEAWTAIMQRFENTLKYQNFPNPAFKKDAGIIVADDTDIKKLTGLLRKMRKINHIPSMFGGSRNIPIKFVIKDPIFRNSSNSFILQMVDVIAFFVKQLYDPNKVIRRKGGRHWYGKLQPVINPKATYSTKNYKIIEL